MKITKEEVEYVAHLGRLTLNEDEKTTYQAQIDDILKYMEMLAEVPTDDVEPMAGPVKLTTPLREDVVRPSLSQEDSLANAPAKTDDFFTVPRIIEHS